MKVVRQFIKEWVYVFVLLMSVFIPFPFHMVPSVRLADTVFGGLIGFFARGFNITLVNPEVSSDSASMYILVFILLTLTLLIVLLLQGLEVWKLNRDRIFPLFRKIFVFYLSLQLMKYGFDKIFGKQFYTPEPNILYTPFGQLDKDILFWSTIGTSYIYSLVTGIVEVAAAFFIMFRKTRTLGLLIAFVSLAEILLVNLAFDISVKLFSSFLLLLVVILLAPQARRIYKFLVLQDMESLKREADTYKLFSHPFVRISLKTLVSGLIVLEALYPAFRNGKEMIQHPELHGAYEVSDVKVDDIIKNVREFPVRRFFIHRDGYLILQDWDERMKDFKIAVNNDNRQMILTDYDGSRKMLSYAWDKDNRLLELNYKNEKIILKARPLDWKTLPALRGNFHWMVDEVGVNVDR